MAGARRRARARRLRVPAAHALAYLWGSGGGPRLGGTLYVLMNAKLETHFRLVPDTTADIGARSVLTLIKNGSRADIVDTYNAVRQRGLGFNVAYIGCEVPTENGTGFDTAYMRRLYAYGLGRGRSGGFWQTRPPALETVSAIGAAPWRSERVAAASPAR